MKATDILVAAARQMLCDAMDEAAALAMLAEEAVAALDDHSALRALGVVEGECVSRDALLASLDAARALLVRAGQLEDDA